MDNHQHYSAYWIDQHISIFKKFLKKFEGQSKLNFLEIGSYEGRSSIWLIENYLLSNNSKLVCIDSFSRTYEYRKDFPEYESRFDDNTRKYINKIIKYKGLSGDLLRNFHEKHFDFIYIDGSHKALDLVQDAVLSFPLLKTGGILAFDDYKLEKGIESTEYPRIAIDAFLKIYNKHIALLHKDQQVWIEKTSNIGLQIEI